MIVRFLKSLLRVIFRRKRRRRKPKCVKRYRISKNRRWADIDKVNVRIKADGNVSSGTIIEILKWLESLGVEMDYDNISFRYDDDETAR